MNEPSGAARVLDAGDRSDMTTIGWSNIRVILLAFAVVFMDGFDTQAISYVAPLIARDWSLPRGAMGSVFSAGLLGLMLGALFIAPLSDRWGRRKLILNGTLGFAVLSLATVLVTNITMLTVLRLVTGLALGTALPNAIALASDYSPARRRGLITMVATSGMSLGSIASGLLTASIGVQHGWATIFAVGGVAPLAIWLILLWKLPESIPYSTEPAARAGASPPPPIGGISAEDAMPPSLTERPARQSIAGLFGAPLRRLTPLLWIALTASMLTTYLIVNWLPSILRDIGFPVAQAATLTSLYHLGGVFGTYMLGLFVIERLGGRNTVLTAVVIAIAGLAIYAGVAHFAGYGLTAIMLMLTGFGIVSMQIALVALAAISYPTHLRATGLGWGLGIGRSGSIVGPVIGGTMIAAAASVQFMLLFCAAVLVVVAVAAFFMGQVRRSVVGEEALTA